MVTQQSVSWVLLSYRIPREPSTPRIAVWRKLKDLGVGQVGDGLVALPSDARTKEQLEWVAAAVIEANGEAIVWTATTARRESEALATDMRSARTAEYQALLDDIGADHDPARRTLQRWRREWRRIDRRDHFRADLRDDCRLAIAAVAQLLDVQAPEGARA
ncbi:MAG: Chromate resistance protein ChrB [Acidimicrobiales bacterium]